MAESRQLTAADCPECGACCREAFDAVPVEAEDRPRLAGLEQCIVEEVEGWPGIARVPSPLGKGTRCALLSWGADGGPPYLCTHYQARTEACRGVEPGGEGCITARRRVGLEPWPEGMRPDGPWISGGGD